MARELATRGWTRLPRLEPADVRRLATIASDVEADLLRRRARVEAGFYELWGYPERSIQQATQPLLAAVLTPFLERCFPEHRAVLFNLWVKRERDDRSAVHFHQDFAFVDERAGAVGLQIWIPLVDVSRDNGALILVDGSHVDASPLRPIDHKHPLVSHSLLRLPPGAEQLALSAGDGVVFTNRTVHGSPPNTSDAPRFAVGAMLVPRGVPIASWFARGPNRLELWTMTDEQFASNQPGELPDGATFVEGVDLRSAPSAPSERLDFGSGAWICYRAIPQAPDRVVVTDARGRFLLLPSTELEALARGARDPDDPRRRRLSELGFLRTPAPAGDSAQSVDGARGAPFVDLTTMTNDRCDALVEAGGAITVAFDAIARVHEANRPMTGAASYEVTSGWIREIRARLASRGVGPETAYINVVSSVTRATVDAGPRAVVDAARGAGVVYLELRPLRVADDHPLRSLVCPPDDYVAFYEEAIRRVLEINEEGTLLVEKRLALHLEALVELAAGRPLATLASPGCSSCAYDRYCGTRLVESHVAEGDSPSKAWRSAWCTTSMGTLDAIFLQFASPEGATLRRVFKRWMSARDRVAAHR
jgi:hypothetical protein